MPLITEDIYSNQKPHALELQNISNLIQKFSKYQIISDYLNELQKELSLSSWNIFTEEYIKILEQLSTYSLEGLELPTNEDQINFINLENKQ